MAASDSAAPGRFRFPAAARLKRGTEILAVLKGGRSVGCRGMKMAWLPGKGDRTRMAIALKRGYGNAVQRNRAKRLIREAWRLGSGGVRGSWDVVFQVFPGPDAWDERSSQLLGLLGRSGLLLPPAGSPPSGGGAAEEGGVR